MDVATVFSDPGLMLFGFEGDMARFVPMTRETYARSIFFDRRLQPAEQRFIDIPLEPLLAHVAENKFEPPGIRFIHHFAHSGSTLLSRALDDPGNLVIREPVHLRQLGVRAGAAATHPLPARESELLALSLTMLGRRFASGSTVIVKGNVPISLLADAIAGADTGQPAILLYFPLEDYCAAVLRTPSHQRWIEAVTVEIGLGKDPLVGDLSHLTVAEQAAALWFAMMKRFERLLTRHPAMRSLDANHMFARPVEAITAASGLLGAGLSPEDAKAVVEGPLFTTYSKNPGVHFDEAARRERSEQAKAQLEPEIRAARRWVDERSGADGSPDVLDRPLLGEEAPITR